MYEGEQGSLELMNLKLSGLWFFLQKIYSSESLWTLNIAAGWVNFMICLSEILQQRSNFWFYIVIYRAPKSI